MAGVGELLASAVLKEVCGKLCSVVWKEIASQHKFTQDLEGLHSMLTVIQAVLADAERRSVREESVCLWLKKLKAVAYDIEDILLDFESAIPPCNPEVQGDIPRQREWSKFSHLMSQFTMARKMKKMRERVQQIKHEMELGNFNFKQDTSSHEQDVIKERRTVASLDEDIVGRVSEKERIMDLLQTEDEPFVIPIHALGGLGKTTLVRMVYNDNQTERAFDVRAWIYVSAKFDLEAIGKCIISQLDGKNCRMYADLQSVHNHVKDILTGKRFLIVLDDVWGKDQDMLAKIKSLLNGGKTGSKVIITTRNKRIAKIMNANLQIELEPLPDSDCWTLFKKIALEPETVGTCFEDIGKVIVAKCKGTPLAVKSLASILRGKELKVWMSVRDSSIWVEDATSSDENQVLPSLKLSYHYMPFHLRLCFAYCSVIPKGCHIEKNSLIQQWIALEFVQSTSNAKVEDCAESYFNELLEMSFFHPISPPSMIAAKHYKPPREFIMHDMVHALATFVAGDEVSILNVPMKSNYHFGMDFCRYTLIESTIDPSTLQKTVPIRARALHFNVFNLMKLPSHMFSFSKFLRVLDLSGCTLVEFPGSISKLRQLKYLCAKGMQIQKLCKPISSLQNLQALMLIDYHYLLKLPSYFSGFLKLHYLDLHGCCSLVELTGGIGNLTGVRHIDLSGCSSLIVLPSTIGQLKNLSYLNLSNCTKLQSLPESFGELTSLEDINLSFCYELGSLPDEFLRKKQQLRFLDLSSCTNIKSLPEFCSENNILEILDLSACHNLEALPVSIGYLRALKRLDLSNCFHLRQLPPLHQHHVLQFLNLSGCSRIEGILKFLAHSTIHNLQYLNLSGVGEGLQTESAEGNITQMASSSSNLIRLEALQTNSSEGDITQMPSSSQNLIHFEAQLNKLIEGMSRLKYLSIDGFTLFSDQRIESMEGLLTLPEFYVNQMFDPIERHLCSNIIVLQQILDLTHSHLNIRNLERLSSPQDARKARLAEKHQLRSLSLMWTVPKYYYHLMQFQEDNTHAALVLEELRPPQKIEELHMEGYRAAIFPGWLMNIGTGLPHVVNIRLSHLRGCTVLPPLGQLQKLKVLHLSHINRVRKVGLDVYGSARPFPMLRELTISDMKMLEEWMTEDVMFPNLEHLEVQRCPYLKFKSYVPMSSRYSIQNCWYIFSHEGVTVGPPCTASPFTSVMNVSTSYPDDIEWSGLQNLVNLEIMINIHDNEQLTWLPEGIRGLCHLKKLEIRNCRIFTMLPSWLGDLANLEELAVYDCGKLATLPKSMLRLGHLQKLVIANEVSKGDAPFEQLPEWLGSLASLWELRLNNYGSPRDGESLKPWDISLCSAAVQARFCLRKDTMITNHIPYISIYEKEFFFVHSTCKQSIVGIKQQHRVGSSSSIVLLQRITRITNGNLSIFSLENVSSPEEAAKADIANISNLLALRLEWSVSTNWFEKGPKVQDEAVLANLRPSRYLLVLDINGYRGSAFSGWLLDETTLPCVREITLSNLPRCRHLPVLGLLPNLEKLHILFLPKLTAVESQPFEKLRELVLTQIGNLEEWSTAISSADGQLMDIAVFPNLKYLRVESCSKLRFSPSFPTSARYFIQNSGKVLSFQGVIGTGISPTSSSKMEINNCYFSLDDLRGFQYLSSLEELTISNCSTLTTLPESITGLHSLKKLHVLQCDNFVTLPECFGHLSSLQEVQIDCTAKVASLPESIRGMASLVDLTFWCDDELERQYRSGMDRSKIAHIRKVKINGRYVRMR